MKTDILKQLTAWQPINQTANSVTLASPLTFGTDGSSISFTILFPQENHFVLTDFGDYALLAEQMGAKLDPKRYQSINHTNGIRFASFNEDGEIQATGNVADLSAALADATKLALALSFRLPKWLPKFNQIRFRSMVETVLRRDIPAQNIVKDYKTTGISGHQLVFPFALTTPERNVLIEPIALKDGKIDWASVYQAHGKFSDLKRLDTHNKRLAILEGDETSEYGAAATVLGDSCHVRTLNTTESWQLQRIIH